MANAPLPLIAGNWKMNATHAEAIGLVEDLASRLDMLDAPLPIDITVCPPSIWIPELAAFLASTPVHIGGQDLSPLTNGAHTGDLSAELLQNAGCACCIVGHSERRRDHGEDNALVLAKATAIHRTRMTAIVCVGETDAERDAGKTLEVVTRQLEGSIPASGTSRNLVVAYEPVWAIGTGRTPTSDEIAEVHAHIREQLYQRFDYDGFSIRVIYGGSVSPKNAAEILRVPNVNGALVGGASLKGESFWEILQACPKPSEATKILQAWEATRKPAKAKGK